MSAKISHSGIVASISKGCVQVRILQTSACAACKVAGHCNASESKEKIVDVLNVNDISTLKVSLIPYYWVLYLMRDKIQKKMSFFIERNN